MATAAPFKPQQRPSFVTHEGRRFPLLFEACGWRLRSRSKIFGVDHRTGTTNLKLAQARAREWLAANAQQKATPKRGGGTLESLAAIYLRTPKRTKENVARDNVSRLRTICRAVLERELENVTCREVGPALWRAYQKHALTLAGHPFDLATRFRENIAINSATRAARCLFLPALLRAYREHGLAVSDDAGHGDTLPEPYVAPLALDDAALVSAWATLNDSRLWLTIGLARFAGLRRDEIAACRVSWIEIRSGAVSVALRDRPEEQWWTKTGKPYRAQVIEPTLAAHLAALVDFAAPDALIVADPPDGGNRAKWFERVPQKWLHAHGVKSAKPLHRLRGAYADHIASVTQDAVAARLAGLRAAQSALGHTTSATTEAHYLTPDALR